MQAEGGSRRKETGGLSTAPEGIDHGRQINVGEPIAVVSKKHLLAFNVLPHGKQAFADAAPDPGVDHGDTPVLLGITEYLHVVAESGNDAVGVGVWTIVEEELLDDVRLVAEAQNEILMAILAVVEHQMAQDRLVADWNHRFRNAFGIVADPRTETSAEQNRFHLHGPFLGSNWACWQSGNGDQPRPAGKDEVRIVIEQWDAALEVVLAVKIVVGC